MIALTTAAFAPQLALAWLPGGAHGQANVALMDLSKQANSRDCCASNTGGYPANSAISSSYQTAEQYLSPELEARLNELSLLKLGWDEGQAMQINSEAVETARSVLRQLSLARRFQGPSIVPTFDGFVQLEWHNAFRSLEFEYTLKGWSILGVAEVAAEHPIYVTAAVPLTAAGELVRFYDWFSTNGSIWPSR